MTTTSRLSELWLLTLLILLLLGLIFRVSWLCGLSRLLAAGRLGFIFCGGGRALSLGINSTFIEVYEQLRTLLSNNFIRVVRRFRLDSITSLLPFNGHNYLVVA